MKPMMRILNQQAIWGFVIAAVFAMMAASAVHAGSQSVPYSFSSGTTASASQVNDNFTFLENRSFDLNVSDIYYNNGNVGIGTNSPSYPLEVSHTVAAFGSGVDTIYALVSDGTDTMIGALAGGYYGYSAVYGKSTRPGTYGGFFWGEGADSYGLYASGQDYGGYFYASNGTAGTTYGIRAKCYPSSGTGYGGHFYASPTSGSGYGVYAAGYSSDGTGYGVYATGTHYGVYGGGTDYGLYGYSITDSNSIGVYGESSTGTGVKGVASGSNGYGVFGEGTHGVYGKSTPTTGSAYSGYFYSSPTAGLNYGVRSLSYGATGYSNWGLYSTAYASSGQSAFGTYSYGSTQGVRGYGGTYDFYAVGNSYGPFTGAHEVKLAESFPEAFTPGIIVSVTGETQKREDTEGNESLSSTMPTVKVSSKPNDKAVFGVIVKEAPLDSEHWYEAADGERFGVVNALGEGRVWVSNINGDIQAGDYITTSVIPGYGQMQHDDLLHSYTLGKSTETIDWDSVTETIEHDGQPYKIYLIAVVYTSG